MPQPRAGFAYDVMGDGKMAIRGGMGLFTERLRQNNFNFGAGGNWPNSTAGDVYNGNVRAINTTGVGDPAAPIQPPGMTVWPSNNTVPSIYSWYAGVQRQLPANFTLDISYSGNHSIHLMNQRHINALPAGTFLSNPNLSKSVNFYNNALLPYYGWGDLTAVETQAYSRYNAMMLRVSRRFSKNLSANFNYTRSKVMDIVDNDDNGVNNPFNIRQNYAVAGYDQPNVITLDFVYMLPKTTTGNAAVKQVVNGWELSSMIRSQSGVPININSNGNLYGVSAGNQYPNLSGDPYAGNNSFQWLNPAAFTRPQDGTYGTLGRNALRMPGVRNFDINMIKNFAITEAAKLQFRAEVFNLFNHPQVWGIDTGFGADNPGGAISANNKNFGRANNYRDARTIQLALRFSF
jgi:hypothetical protein